MDMNLQIKILENLLRKEENRECADCSSKTPRWASTTFGSFVCLRCSGMHRQLQVHITKVRSVNLDKWTPEMLEQYKHMNNVIINAYWEAKLPNHYQKPGQNASPSEVETFIKDKYLQKKWVDPKMGADPVTLFRTDKNKFEKFIAKLRGQENEEEEEEEEEQNSDDEKGAKKKRKEERKQRREQKEKKETQQQADKKLPSSKQQQQVIKPPVAVENLISFESQPAAKTDPLLDDGFSDFKDSTHTQASFQGNQQANTDGFSDFQGGNSAGNSNHNSGSFQQAPNQAAGGINIQGLYAMYNQTSAATQPKDRFAPFNNAFGQYPGQQPTNFSGGQGQQQPFSPNPQMSHSSGFNNFNNQQYPQQTNQFQQPGGFQPAYTAQNPMFTGLSNNSGNNIRQQNPQPNFANNMTGNQNQYQGGYPNSFQQPLQQNPQGGMYGNLVNLSNLNGQQQAATTGGYGAFSGGGQQTQQRDKFGGLLSGQW